MKHPIRISPVKPSTGALDFSHLLDAPAGCHGFVTARDGHFYFEDGKRARFLGFNIATRSNTPSHEDAKKLAARFASMGVNVIRLHAADAPLGDGAGSWSSSRKTPLLDYDKGTTRLFHPEGLDRFDYLCAALKEKGIYLHIDLIVARAFLAGDELEFSGEVPSCTKRYPMYNERLIELQKEYAKELLCHVNPYTGLALKDDPAVITVQINNEESAIKGTDGSEALKPYKDEVSRRFGEFLLAKYQTREGLKEAWTFEGLSALGEDEDPSAGTVRGIEGSFYQVVNEPTGPWDAPEGPARYADFMEFGAEVNRSFYQKMKAYLRSLGVKVPIVASNLMAGAADVYGHTDGDLMENNSYFNHPILPIQNDTYMVYGPAEYVSTDPLSIQRGVGALGTTILSLASVAVVAGKPFMISEWNEYGLHPFHSTAFIQTIAYACLNDWDGLILYNYNTSEHPEDEPDDEILTVFDAYNDPALISQWGFMASVFLKGLLSPARNKTEVVYTKEDIKTLPNFHAMPMCFLPYVTSLRSVFLEKEERYSGDADVALNAGFLNNGDLSDARHGVYYAWSPYRDVMRRQKEENRLMEAAKDTRLVGDGVHLGEKTLVFDEIAKTAAWGDYHLFASMMDQAMKEWGLIGPDCGFVDGKLISDTGEISFDPSHARFSFESSSCAYFSGAPEERIRLGEKVEITSMGERISLALMPREGGSLSDAKELLLTAVGKTGTDAESFSPGPELMPGISMTMVRKDGKLYAETLDGTVLVKAKGVRMIGMDLCGNELGEIPGVPTEDGTLFTLTGDLPALQYRIELND